MPFELIKPDTRIDFVGQAKYAIALSLAIVAAAVAAMFVREPAVRLGIDFTGGMEMQLRFARGRRRRREPRSARCSPASISRTPTWSGSARAARARTCCACTARRRATRTSWSISCARRSTQQLGAVDVQSASASSGPKVGEELRRDGLVSLTVASVLLLIYIGFRFTPIFAPGAIVAQVHDVVVTAALLVILGCEFDLTVLGALLAILGYSINDKIVVYDRIRENLALHTAYDFPNMVNDSLNQTLSRTILTGGTAIFASFALYFWGGPVIATFGLAMALGIIVGTYSSLYITTPILLWLHKRYGKQIAAARPAGERRAASAAREGERRRGAPSVAAASPRAVLQPRQRKAAQSGLPPESGGPASSRLATSAGRVSRRRGAARRASPRRRSIGACDGACAAAPGFEVIWIEPFTTAPSATTSRGAITSPSTMPVAWISTRSVPRTLPATRPITTTDFACTSALIAPFAPIVSRLLGSVTLPSTLPSITRSSSPVRSPLIVIDLPMFAMSPFPSRSRPRGAGGGLRARRAAPLWTARRTRPPRPPARPSSRTDSLCRRLRLGGLGAQLTAAVATSAMSMLRLRRIVPWARSSAVTEVR